MPLIAETPAALGSPVPLLELGRALREQRIACCQWKGHDAPERWATGRGDIDLLVDRTAAARFHALALRSGFKETVPPPAQRIPGLAEYVGLDPATGVLLRLHVRYRLVVGLHGTARYRLPLEQAVLDEAMPALPFPVPPPEWALILFVLRKALQEPQPRALPAAWSGTADALESIVTFGRLKAALERHLPAVPYACFDACLSALTDRDAERWRREAALLRKRLAPLRERAPVAAIAAVAAARLSRLVSRYAAFAGLSGARPHGRKRLASGGVIVALVGDDGAGQSKAALALETWLAPALRVLRIHAGRPPRSFATLVVSAALELARRSLGRHAERSALIDRLEMVRCLCTALDRLRLCEKASRFAVGGGIVIAEQYPLRHDASPGGPTIAAPAAGRPQVPLVPPLIPTEEDLHARIPPPDAVVLLRVTPEVAAARGTDEPADHQPERNRLVLNADWNGARSVDADQPFAEMLHELREVVWQAL